MSFKLLLSYEQIQLSYVEFKTLCRVPQFSFNMGYVWLACSAPQSRKWNLWNFVDRKSNQQPLSNSTALLFTSNSLMPDKKQMQILITAMSTLLMNWRYFL